MLPNPEYLCGHFQNRFLRLFWLGGDAVVLTCMQLKELNRICSFELLGGVVATRCEAWEPLGCHGEELDLQLESSREIA